MRRASRPGGTATRTTNPNQPTRDVDGADQDTTHTEDQSDAGPAGDTETDQDQEPDADQDRTDEDAEPVDGVELLNDLHDTLTRYVVFPDEHSSVATTLWITVTHALPAFDCAPRLTLKSPQKRCGKTRTLDVIAGTCHPAAASSTALRAA
jgi:hypothetical protein